MLQPQHNENRPQEVFLHVFGNNVFNNQILADYLREHTGIPCRQLSKAEIAEELCTLPGEKNLILVDYSCLKELNPKESVCLDRAARSPHFWVMLFQADPERKDEIHLFKKGVRAILYRNQPIGLYPRAVKAVLEGELWYPRRTLEQLFLEEGVPLFIPNTVWHLLTGRQKEILRLLSAGKSNKEIADKLCLSPHTIKTHIYHIYKKLEVRNRLEASVKVLEETSSAEWS